MGVGFIKSLNNNREVLFGSDRFGFQVVNRSTSANTFSSRLAASCLPFSASTLTSLFPPQPPASSTRPVPFHAPALRKLSFVTSRADHSFAVTCFCLSLNRQLCKDRANSVSCIHSDTSSTNSWLTVIKWISKISWITISYSQGPFLRIGTLSQKCILYYNDLLPWWWQRTLKSPS